MKTIFRHASIGLLMAAILALGVVAGLAQNPCEDAEGQTALYDKFLAKFPDKSIDGRAGWIEIGKVYLEKYSSCEAFKMNAEYFKENIPKWETKLTELRAKKAKDDLITRFDNSLKAKNWDEVYASGKEILQRYPDEFRDAELVMGSIGLDETAKTPRVTKWNEDTLRFAKQSIADLEAGKTFKTFGVGEFKYKSKEDSLGWMNYTIGYIYFFDKNDKKQGLSYLYKATQMNSDTKSNPIIYSSIGSYYFDDVKKLAGEVTALEAKQDPNATPEVQKALVDEIKAKVALVNGTAEAAIDAYARAYNLAKADTKSPKAYNDSLYKTLQNLYNVRFGKMDGFDAFVANTVKKPLPNPLNPVTPISDPEPVATPAATTTTPATTTAKPGATVTQPTTTAKPGATTTVKPAGPIKPAPGTKPGTGAKPQANVKKPVVKRRAA